MLLNDTNAIVLYIDLHLPVQSVPITTIRFPPLATCNRDNLMTYGRSMGFIVVALVSTNNENSPYDITELLLKARINP